MAISRIMCTGWALTDPDDTDRGVRFRLAQAQEGGTRQVLAVRVMETPDDSQLADNTLDSVHRGDSLIVAGRLVTTETRDGLETRTETLLLADAIGHDLRYGTSRWTRTPKDER